MYRSRILCHRYRPGFRAASSSQPGGRPQDSSKVIMNNFDTRNITPVTHEVTCARPQGITSDEVNKSLTRFPLQIKMALRFSCSGSSHQPPRSSILQSSFIMSDSDGELDLLDQDQPVQKIGEHELRTSPLVTRDAIARSYQFSQRGLLGSVLSVHASGLPPKTSDPRIYLNLDAPSSGLVCGVQVSLSCLQF
jgi:hypothetical protein